RRDRADRAIVRLSAASVHVGTAQGDPAARSGREAARSGADRRTAIAVRAAVRLPLPHALPSRDRALRCRGAPDAQARARALRGLSFSADRTRLKKWQCGRFLIRERRENARPAADAFVE